MKVGTAFRLHFKYLMNNTNKNNRNNKRPNAPEGLCPVEISFILTSHLSLGLPGGLLPVFIQNPVCMFSSMHVVCPAHLSLLPLDHPNSIWQQTEVTKSLIVYSSVWTQK